MITCYNGIPGQGMSYETAREILKQHQEPQTMKLTSPAYNDEKEPISKEQLVAGLLFSGRVHLVEARMRAKDRNLTIRIRNNGQPKR